MSKPPRTTFAQLPADLRALAAGRSVVAFDVFDTLLLRHVAADDIKELCAREFATALDQPEQARVFYSRRRALERELCEESLRRGGDREFRHADLVRRWVDDCAKGADAEPIRNALAAFELDRELALTTPSPTARAALELVAELGLRAIWISDSFLPLAAIDELLATHDLRRYFAAGYVSSTDRHTKRSGRLYVDVLTSEHMHADQLLVVGDDRQADVDAPRALGAHVLWLHDTAARARRRALAKAHSTWRRDAQSAGPRLALVADCDLDHPPPHAAPSPHRELGELLAATFVAFALDVLEQARAHELRRVVFLSREGATLQRLYRQLARTLALPGSPSATYFCASRRSTFLPSLLALDIPTLTDRLWQRRPQQSLRQLLDELGLDADGLAPIAAEHDLLELDATLSDPATDQRLAAFLADPRTQLAFTGVQQAARANLLAYARARGLAAAEGAIGIVAVGWHGTIQSRLVAALGDAAPEHVAGFYLALAGGDDDGEHSTKRGYVYDHRRDPRPDATLLENSHAFEMFATARHRAIVGYGERRRRPRPILADAAHSGAALAREVRRAMFARAARLIAAIGRLRPTAAELRPWVLAQLHQYVRYPSTAQARAFLAYTHADGSGATAAVSHELYGAWKQIVLGGAPWKIPERARAAFATQEWPGAALRRSRVPGLNWLYDRYRQRHSK